MKCSVTPEPTLITVNSELPEMVKPAPAQRNKVLMRLNRNPVFDSTNFLLKILDLDDAKI